MNSRDIVLAKISGRLNAKSDEQVRFGKARSRISAHPANTVPARGRVAAREQVLLFEEMLARVHGTVSRVDDLSDVPNAINDYLESNDLGKDIYLARDVADLELDWVSAPGLKIEHWQARQSVAVGVTGCYAAVAETGSLVVCSSVTHGITMNFLSEANIILLSANDIVGVYEEIWTRIRKERDGHLPRDMTLISSPSCTGDIEMILEYGAHGPKYLHVIIIE